MAILELAEVLRRDVINSFCLNFNSKNSSPFILWFKTGDATFWIFLILNMLTFTAGLFWFNILIVGLSSYLSGLEMAKVYGKNSFDIFSIPLFIYFFFRTNIVPYFTSFASKRLFISVFNFFNFESPIITWKSEYTQYLFNYYQLLRCLY
jgi:hypothetical protein